MIYEKTGVLEVVGKISKTIYTPPPEDMPEKWQKVKIKEIKKMAGPIETGNEFDHIVNKLIENYHSQGEDKDSFKRYNAVLQMAATLDYTAEQLEEIRDELGERPTAPKKLYRLRDVSDFWDFDSPRHPEIDEKMQEQGGYYILTQIDEQDKDDPTADLELLADNSFEVELIDSTEL